MHLGVNPVQSDTTTINQSKDYSQLFNKTGEQFSSEAEMKTWLLERNVDLQAADSKKGLRKLFGKLENQEARLVFDAEENRVYRLASVARINTEVTIHGQLYPLIELCQIFLKDKIDAADLQINDPEKVAGVLSRLNVRSAQVRDSQELWETLIGGEDPLTGARRGVEEELGLSAGDAQKVQVKLIEKNVEYEAPIDWPGIHSVLEINDAAAVIPEEISKPVYAELEAGDQLSIFVASPNSAVLRALMGIIIPKINYTS